MLQLATKFIPVSNAFERAHLAGFSCAEFWSDANVLAGFERLIEDSRRVPLRYVLHFPNRAELTKKALDAAVTIFRDLGCQAMVIHRPMFEKYGRRLLERQPNLRLGVENHRLTPEEFSAWAEDNPWLTLDIEHLWKFTLEDAALATLEKRLKRFLAKHAEKLVHVHLPGYLPGQPEHRPMYCSRDMVFLALDLLTDAGYQGMVVSEVSKKFQTANDLQMDALLFSTWLERSQVGANGSKKQVSTPST